MLRRALVLAAVTGAALPAPAHAAAPGTVTAAEPLAAKLWIPETTGKAFRLTYVTEDGRGAEALSTGALFLPRGEAPAGGWPVISWAHGTSGLGDDCAPTVVGPALPERDYAYLATWMRQGYAVVASDYAGLGTEGLPAYLHGRSEAHNVVDMVKAGRAFAQEELGTGEQLSNRWATIGQSQGAGAAIYTARHATDFGGPGLRYVGAVGTGTPAYIENYVSLLGPKVPPVALPGGLTAYLSYILTSVRDVHPALGIDGVLTDVGRLWLERAETACYKALAQELDGVSIGDFFTQPLATLPGWRETIADYLAMPERGFDKPFFMGHGVRDLDVPYPPTALYALALQGNGQPVTFRSYANDHSGTLLESQQDTLPFVRGLFAAAGAHSTPRLALAGRKPRLRTALRRGLAVRLDGEEVPVVARHRGVKVASGRGGSTVRLSFTGEARRRLARLRRATLRITAADAALTLTLRR